MPSNFAVELTCSSSRAGSFLRRYKFKVISENLAMRFFPITAGSALAEMVADKIIIDKSDYLMTVYSG
jgi:hypothetical protein